MNQTRRNERLSGRLRRCFLPALIGAMVALAACATKRHARSPSEIAAARDVPSVLRGTVGSESDFRGIEPVLVSGLGVVVGLNGTGGGELPVQIQTTMERELALGGIGKGGAAADTEMGGVSPQQFLRSADVAVVIVQAAIPPGAPKGTVFDVFVRTLPGSSVTSLEGGLLWSTDLRIGPAGVFGAVKTRRIAEARGSVFVNPFSAPSVGPDGGLQLTRTVGRVLGGGTVTDPLRLELILDNDSHSRARAIVAAINSRFPAGPGDDGPIARGRGSNTVGTGPEKPDNAAPSYQSIAVRVPYAMRTKPADFINLVRHLRIDPSFPQEAARSYVEALKSEPSLGGDISWMLQAIGKPAVPFLASMYDYPEFVPRIAALEAGAKLGDQRAIGPLVDLAVSGPPNLRGRAIRLLSDMPQNPTINLTLRELVEQKDLDVRIAAYEGLRARGDPLIRSITVGDDPRRPKFVLDVLPLGDPMVYITQQGDARVVVLGSSTAVSESEAAGDARSRPAGMRLNRPLLISAWNDRLMLTAESADAEPRVYYRDPRTGRTRQGPAPADLVELIQFLARVPTPDEPASGLGLSYSDVVGALYEITRHDGVSATFATEQDRLRAEIFEASRVATLVDRPESESPQGDDLMVFKPLEPATGSGGAGQDPPDSGGGRLTRVVPLTKPKAKKGE